jgi:hypothetical protein
MGVNDTVGTINTTLRTFLMLVLVGGAGWGGYKAYEIYNEPVKQLADKQAELDTTIEKLNKTNDELEESKKAIDDLSVQLAEKTAQVEKLELSIRLMQVRRRLARMTVLDQQPIADATPTASPTGASDGNSSKDLLTKIEFVEVNEKGDPISRSRILTAPPPSRCSTASSANTRNRLRAFSWIPSARGRPRMHAGRRCLNSSRRFGTTSG